MPKRIFIDMDGVIVDFEHFMHMHGKAGDDIKRMPGAYLQMLPINLALQSVQSLVGMGFDVWLATKPPTGIPFAYADKVQWVLTNLPYLKRKIILTHDKSLLLGDYLIDDRPHKANADKFIGQLLYFGKEWSWPEVIEFFRTVDPNAESDREGIAGTHRVDGALRPERRTSLDAGSQSLSSVDSEVRGSVLGQVVRGRTGSTPGLHDGALGDRSGDIVEGGEKADTEGSS